jgi:transcriptional regulator with XRE-family HTH domain
MDFGPRRDLRTKERFMAETIPRRSLTSRTLRVEMGRRLTRLRLARNVTQRALAEEAGIGQRTLGRIEAGHSCSLDSFLRLAIVLGVAEALLSAVPSGDIRPIERVDSGGRERQRARRRRGRPPKEAWSWAEDVSD